ncbi:MAG: HK97 family phage prohead protease [Alphaproteobacteria bacterium]|nr:HK97 family phage prohead protease [Alphaproteobacteria bacterium]
MKTECFDSPFELKFLSSDTGVFEGYASVFGVTDNAGDIIRPGAFAKSLRQTRADERLPPLLWQHDPAQPIGAWLDMREDSHGLFVKGQLFLNDIALAREAWTLLKENVVTGLSIGYRVRGSHRDAKDGLRVLTDIELLEISMVTFPANEFARIRRVKSQLAAGDVPSARDCEAVLREAGFSRKRAKGLLSHGYKALLTDPREADDQNDADTGELVAMVQGLAAAIRTLT